MKRLRNIRVALAVVFFTSAALLALFPLISDADAPLWLRGVADVQILPSALFLRSSVAVTAGVTFFWLLLSCFFGRIYCSTVCPIGTLCDGVDFIRRKCGRKPRNFRFAQPQPVRNSILIIYLSTLLIGQLAFAFLIEPWNIWRNIFSSVAPADAALTWRAVGLPVGIGIAAGAVALVAIVLISLRSGRGFCTAICPVGTALGIASGFAPSRIAIDPDRCISCMKCEEVCPARCVKVVSRYVDNTRCVRCFDCIADCPVKAIGFSSDNHRPSAPLFIKTKQNETIS